MLKISECTKIDKMDPPGEAPNPNLNYNLLLQQIQTLSELQNNGGIQNADPSIQVGTTCSKYNCRFDPLTVVENVLFVKIVLDL